MAYLLDTGVLLRLFDRSDPHHAGVQVAIRRLMHERQPLFTAAQNIAEFWNVSTRPSTARGGYGHSAGRVRRRVAAIERFCEIVTEDMESYELWKTLVDVQGMTGIAVHDARLAAVMMARGISHILTLDAGGFHRFSAIQVELPTHSP